MGKGKQEHGVVDEEAMAQTPVVSYVMKTPQEIWQRAKHRVIDEGLPSMNDLLVKALEAYLK